METLRDHLETTFGQNYNVIWPGYWVGWVTASVSKTTCPHNSSRVVRYTSPADIGRVVGYTLDR